MTASKRIPIAVAKAISKNYEKSQVIILAFDAKHGVTSVVTYGKTLADSSMAAEGGNKLKRVLGWPEDQCKAVPARVARAKKRKTT